MPDWKEVQTYPTDKIPLNDNQRGVIDANRHALVVLIDPDSGIIDRLHDNKCFNSQHKDYMKCGERKCDKVHRLLDIMRRRSVDNFNNLADALDEDGQPLLAQILKQGGGKRI